MILLCKACLLRCTNFEASGNDLDNWDVSNVNNMHGMFFSCHNLTGGDLKSWDVERCFKYVLYVSRLFQFYWN